MKISELKDEAALIALADMIEPLSEIFNDAEVKQLFRKDMGIKGITPMIKKHTKAVMQVLAAAEGVPVEEYHCSFLTLPAQLVDLFSDPMMQDFFRLQAQVNKVSGVSGSATENTAAEK